MKNSSPPCLIWAEGLDSVTVRFPIGALLMTLPVSTEDVFEPQAATNNRSARRLNARIYLDMIFDLLMKQRPTRVTQTRKSAALNCGNSDEKAHCGLGISRSEERGVEYKRDWNTEEGYLPNLNEA